MTEVRSSKFPLDAFRFIGISSRKVIPDRPGIQ